MARTYTDARWHSAYATSLDETVQRLERVADLMDSAVLIPGTRVRFGADALIGLVPGIGDALTTAISLWLIYEAHRIGAPRALIARMLVNIALDGAVGSVPILGDLFDLAWRSNRRNMRLLRDHLERRRRI